MSRLVALLAALFLVVAACSPSEEQAEEDGDAQGAQANVELAVDMSVAPAQLDPSNNTGSNDSIFGNFYVRLVQLGTKPGPDGTSEADPTVIEPYLAESWDVSPDGTVYTFNLREETVFSDGEPVNAEAVKYSFERNLTMGLAGAYFVEDGLPGNIESIEAPEEYQVVITVKQPDPNLLQAWAQPPAAIVNPAAVEDNGGVQEGETNEWMASHVAGSGPFLLESYEPNSEMVLTRNPDYFGDLPAASKITVNFVNAESTLLLRAENGESDVTLGLTPQALSSLEEGSGVSVVKNGTTLTQWLGLVNGSEPLDNVTFRQALAHAVPYDDIISEIVFGFGQPFFGPIPPSMPFYSDTEDAYEFNIDTARSLIQESGVATPVELSMLIQTGNPIQEQIATTLQAVWRDIDVDLSVEKLSPSDYITRLTEHKNVQTYLREDGPGVIDPGYYLDYAMRCEIGFNLSEICIPKADELLTEARGTQSESERQALYDQITELWVEQAPSIPLYQIDAGAVLQDGVTGYFYNQIGPDFRTWGKGGG